jgi:hypothetical protein
LARKALLYSEFVADAVQDRRNANKTFPGYGGLSRLPMEDFLGYLWRTFQVIIMKHIKITQV